MQAVHDTEQAYNLVDNAFQPDSKRHSNFIGAEARVLGNKQAQGELAKVMPPDKDGKISVESLNAALVDPKIGPKVQGALKELIAEQQNSAEQKMHDNDSSMPRWIQFTDAQAEKRGNYENAKQDARIMGSATQEMDGALAEFAQARENTEKLAKAQAQAQAVASSLTTPTAMQHVETHSAPNATMTNASKSVQQGIA